MGSRASCHLFNTSTGVDIASYRLTNNSALDKHTALIMASLYREGSCVDGEWCMRIISDAANGRTAKQLITKLQFYLRNNPPPAIQEVAEPDIIVNAMPEDVEIEVCNSSTATTATATGNVFVPTIPGSS